MADQEQTPEESGELTREDIDAALAGGGAESAPEPADSAPLSQADINAAFGDGAAPEAREPAPAHDGALSQADIDAALGGEAPAEGAEAASPDTAVSEPIASADLAQADIDAALAEAVGAGAPEGESAPPADTRVDATGRPFDAAAAAMAAAIEEEKAAATAAPPETSSVELPDFTAEGDEEGEEDHGISLIQDVDLRVKIELGRTRMLVEDVLALGEGSVVELDKLAGDPVDVFVNERLIARGEVLVLNDNFCVRISEIVSNADARQVG